MRKIIVVIIVFAVAIKKSSAQLSPETINDLKKQLSLAINDSTRAALASEIGSGYRFSNVDSSLLYTDLGINYSRKRNDKILEGYLLSLKGAT